MQALKRHTGWLILLATVLAVHGLVLLGIAFGPNPEVTSGEVYTQIGHILSERLEGGAR